MTVTNLTALTNYGFKAFNGCYELEIDDKFNLLVNNDDRKLQVYFNHSLDKSQTKEALADYGCVEIDEAIELPQVIIEMIKDGVVV